PSPSALSSRFPTSYPTALHPLSLHDALPISGTPGGNALANNAAIEGHPAYGIEQITAAAGPLLDNLNVTVANLKNDLGQFTPKLDRKSTRLNSSHEWISYAVFCLKKKKTKRT